MDETGTSGTSTRTKVYFILYPDHLQDDLQKKKKSRREEEVGECAKSRASRRIACKIIGMRREPLLIGTRCRRLSLRFRVPSTHPPLSLYSR